MGMKKIAVIGCGVRGDCYLYNLREYINKEIELIGVADPNPVACEIFIRNYGNPKTQIFTSGPSLLEKLGDNLDGVIITSPNAYHKESLIPAFQMKLPVLLEKPIGITFEELKEIWKEYVRANQPPIIVGFVLRYTPFFSFIYRIVRMGKIGKILIIESSENMGPPLVSLYLRGWRRKKEIAGPLILEKCSHDIDILLYLTQSRVKRISSFSSLTHFIPRKDIPLHCKDCKIRKICRYSDINISPYLIESSRKKEIEPLLKQPDFCVFNIDKDIPDHQVTTIEFENGTLATFTITMDHPYTTRYLFIKGTEGTIWGDISQNKIFLKYHTSSKISPYTEEKIEISHDGSGHHGGDRSLSLSFLNLLKGRKVPQSAGLKEGIEACLVALAAEKSATEGNTVEMEGIYREIF
ncbi:MAG TPA: Gfo/Idh/MocA family oxidoreductase [Firmicutes bacterium]|nr:Gfo/Idh/MocA family oxidoreductase [Bacillota bacterium]